MGSAAGKVSRFPIPRFFIRKYPWLLIVTAALCCKAAAAPRPAADGARALTEVFAQEVTPRLTPPDDEQARYAGLLETLLAPRHLTEPQYVVLVDRSPFVQAVLVYFFEPARFEPAGFEPAGFEPERSGTRLIGASPASTGKPGREDYFTTPTGVFAHSLDNPDFRAEGTLNENGIRGYGVKGMRVFDFGWQQALRGWGRPYFSTIRLQMHATDPKYLEPRLGSAQSKGCIRIHASMDAFLDRHGILDVDYEQAEAAGRSLWVLRPDREPVGSPGRYLVVVDTQRTARPEWSPLPKSH